MPIQPCSEDGKPGYKFGESGKCYTYSAGDESSRSAAHEKARRQGAAQHVAKGLALPRAWIAEICPSCAGRMEAAGLASLAVRQLSLPLRKAIVGKWSDPGFFQHCMDTIVPKAQPSDPESFCAWLHNELTGIWPGEHRGGKSSSATLVKAADGMEYAPEGGRWVRRWEPARIEAMLAELRERWAL